MGVLSDKMDTFVKYQSAHAIREAASNQSGGAGIGTQFGAGLALGEMLKQTMSPNVVAETKSDDADKKYCPKCGAANLKNAKFCSECGGKMVVAGKCPKCSADVTSKSKFCPECGEKLK